MTEPFGEEAAVAEIATWAALAANHTTAEASRIYFRKKVQQLLADGRMPYAEAIRKIECHHRDVDLALREHVAALLTLGEGLPEELRTFAHHALFNPPVTYPKGRVTIDDFTRNIAASVLVDLTLKRWPDLKETRSRGSRRARQPSACSLVAAAMNRALADCNFSEGRVEQIVADFRKGRVEQKLAS